MKTNAERMLEVVLGRKNLDKIPMEDRRFLKEIMNWIATEVSHRRNGSAYNIQLILDECREKALSFVFYMHDNETSSIREKDGEPVLRNLFKYKLAARLTEEGHLNITSHFNVAEYERLYCGSGVVLLRMVADIFDTVLNNPYQE